jgi:uncharacterized FAD-dependent dehydrogenase
MKKYKFDIVVIGAGPSGLATGCALKTEFNRCGSSFVILDSGVFLEKRNRFDPVDIVSGIGGAGLFSDGKFSFFPSATRLWLLQNKDLLKCAYEWYCDFLSRYVILDKSVSDFSTTINDGKMKDLNLKEWNLNWNLKSYPSIYVSLKDRYSLIRIMCDLIGHENIMTNTNVISYERLDKEYIIKAMQNQSESIEITCKKIVIGAGRVWPLFNRNVSDKFMRLEFGVRIQDIPERKFFTSNSLKDPKYIYTDKTNNVEYRTFCCCRRGEIITTNCNGIKTLSGRADCLETNESNVGFNVRILNKKVSNQILAEIKLINEPFDNVSIRSVINDDALKTCYGSVGNEYLKRGLELILEKFPDFKDAKISGPTLEGIGQYPESDNNLKMINENIWIVGDVSGKFRGITAAIVSGYYVGRVMMTDKIMSCL